MFERVEAATVVGGVASGLGPGSGLAEEPVFRV
jgi:hypothetical protein